MKCHFCTKYSSCWMKTAYLWCNGFYFNSNRSNMMQVVELVRLERSQEGVVGVLRINKQIEACTLEPPDLSNRANVSCIPPGQYFIEGVDSPKFGKTYTVLGVPERSNILFHSGNTSVDTHGCILIGETIGKLKGNRAVLNSGATFKKFMETLGIKGERASFTIIESY